MGFRKEFDQNSSVAARQRAAQRVSKNIDRYLLSTLVIGAYLLFTYWSFYNIGMRILQNPLSVYLALGIGAFGGYNLVLYCTPKRKKPLEAAPKQPLLPPPDIHEFKSTKDKPLKKEISLPMFAMIKRKGHAKKSQTTSPTLLTKAKDWFSVSHWKKRAITPKKSINDTMLETQGIESEEIKQIQQLSHDFELKSQNPMIEKKTSPSPRFVPPRTKKTTSTKKIFALIPPQATPSLSTLPREEISTSEDESTTHETKTLEIPSHASQPALFKPNSNDNIYIKKERLPASFLELSELINQLTQKNLTLTGGVLTSLLRGSNQFNDLDCILFEEQAVLLNLLLEAKPNNIEYSCKEISKKNPIIRVILAENHAPPCELIYLPHASQTSFSNVEFKSSAAYIRTKDSLFYVNKTNNTCTEIKCHTSISTNSLSNSGMLKQFDLEMLSKKKNKAKDRMLSLYELHQITSITNHAHTKLIEVDIKCCKKHEGVLENAIKNNMKKRDFKLSALYSNVLPSYDTLIIKGFDGAISSVNREMISAVDPDTLFQKPDHLLCLFRLATIKLKHPNFEYDPTLQDILNKTIFENLFNDFIFAPVDDNGSAENPNNITHLSQINTRLNKLFTTFDTNSVIKILCDLNIIQTMTGIQDTKFILDTAENFANYIDTLPNHYKKTAFYYFIYMHYCLSPNNTNKTSLINKAMKTLEPKFEAPDFKNHIDYIEKHSVASNRMLPKSIFTPDPAFSKMLYDIKLKFLETSGPCQIKLGA